ncbi:deazaflavin-dependent oxidoreductase, nitroreductase family [Cryobacterium psychrotolerans]|uniref:Deazaflavin-dependent oxidoreductase, nitroreductase family n=1 Tax=Cryobacterium psychrotolerans TaxID=386301 RepID=A0A1G9DR49_9MICO|nr:MULTISPECIES: nitroreductase family deazaflavin-dependent oxidoreductase [Cryobacterium]TFD44418.1 nitroreductase family deazaflavin-dependent oxidoreductase [Cryobacterium sp. TMT1-2-1]TFD83377.1 nitroreductase family deazaflavin-dependent oxidoreductase [Cryobacterium psychrotolerans]SDK66361.1 deazaflavin-dependent oxidoreductase, nitroreductase family [Cryobacterium psychrotolerans]
MSLRNNLTDLMMRAMSGGHRALLKLSGGRLLRSIGTMPAVELHTIGRATGHHRSTMLTAPVHGEGRYVLVASKGGGDRNPMWYLNLVANPDVELTVDGATTPMRARTATAAEKAELWPKIVAAYRGYADYQRRTTRDIPVVICEPR